LSGGRGKIGLFKGTRKAVLDFEQNREQDLDVGKKRIDELKDATLELLNVHRHSVAEIAKATIDLKERREQNQYRCLAVLGKSQAPH